MAGWHVLVLGKATEECAAFYLSVCVVSHRVPLSSSAQLG